MSGRVNCTMCATRLPWAALAMAGVLGLAAVSCNGRSAQPEHGIRISATDLLGMAFGGMTTLYRVDFETVGEISGLESAEIVAYAVAESEAVEFSRMEFFILPGDGFDGSFYLLRVGQPLDSPRPSRMMFDLLGESENPVVKVTGRKPPYSIDCTEHEEGVGSFRKDGFLPIGEEVVLYQQHWKARKDAPESKRDHTVASLLGWDDLAWTLDDLIERSKDGRIIIVVTAKVAGRPARMRDRD